MSTPVPEPVSQHTEYVFDQCNSLSVYFLVASILEAVAFGASWGMNLGDRFMRTTGGRESEVQVEARPAVYSVLPPVVMGVVLIIWGASTEKDMLDECRAGLGPHANILWYYATSLNLYMAGMSWVIIYSLVEGHRRRRLKRENKQKKVDDSKRILDDMSPAGIVQPTTPSTEEEEAVDGVALT